ncbi:hypothetical protein HKX48_001618 [Thoreauomyces humboldtii]|nr:hypothetical protein HKX48_001618 [Thoreauomyces humboldtii]
MNFRSYLPSIPSNYQLELLGPNNPLGSLHSVILINVGAGLVAALAVLGLWRLASAGPAEDPAGIVETLKRNRRKSEAKAAARVAKHRPKNGGWKKVHGKWVNVWWKDNDSSAESILYPPGLANMGNTCFMNSVIQAVSALPTMCTYLQDRCARERSCSLFPQDEEISPLYVTSSMRELTSALNELTASRRSIRPTNLMGALSAAKQNNMRLLHFNQEDAHELYVAVASSVNDEEADTAGLKSLLDVHSLLDKTPAPWTARVPNVVTHLPRTKEGSVPEVKLPVWKRSPMNGLSASAMICQTCNYSPGTRHEFVNHLQLNVPISHRRLTLEYLLDCYVQPEPIHDYICDRCSLRATLAKAEGDVARQEERIAELRSRAKTETSSSGTPQRKKRKKKSAATIDSIVDEDSVGSQSDGVNQIDDLSKRATRSDRDGAVSKVLEEESARLVQMQADETVIRDTLAANGQLPKHMKLIKIAVPLTKRLVMVATPPQCLCLHMQRSVQQAYGAVKNNAPVIFPEFLDMGPYCTVDSFGTYNATGVRLENWSSDGRQLKASPLRQQLERNAAVGRLPSAMPFNVFMADTTPASFASTQIPLVSMDASKDLDIQIEDSADTAHPVVQAKAVLDAPTPHVSEDIVVEADTFRYKSSDGENSGHGMSETRQPSATPAFVASDPTPPPSVLSNIPAGPTAAIPAPKGPTRKSARQRNLKSGSGMQNKVVKGQIPGGASPETSQTPSSTPGIAPGSMLSTAPSSQTPPPTSSTTSKPTSSYPYLYRLDAVVVHYGSHERGHYVTYRRMHPPPHSSTPRQSDTSPPRSSPTGTGSPSSSSDDSDAAGMARHGGGGAKVWYRMSDSDVDLVADFNSEVLGHGSEHVFMLFYERISA